MLFELDAFWLLMAVAGVGTFGFMFGSALDALTGDDGFGAFGNMVILVAGFFGAIILANRFGYALQTPMLACGVGLGGAFCCFTGLALVKAGIARL